MKDETVMSDNDAIFFLENMKKSLLGGIQNNVEIMNKFEAAAVNGMIAKQIEALEIAIKNLRGNN